MFFKRFIVLALAIFIVGCSNSAGVKRDSFAKDDRVTIYYVHRDDCPACAYMDRVIQRKDIKSILKKDFKLIKVDFKDQKILPDSSMVTNKTPTLYFIKDNKQVREPIHALNPDAFKKILNSLK